MVALFLKNQIKFDSVSNINQNTMSFRSIHVLHANRLLLLIITCCSLILCLEGVAAVQIEKDVTNIGAILNMDSRIGQEQKAAMEIAAESFNNNNSSNTHELILHFQDSGGDPFRATSAAEELMKEKKVEVIVGMETWQEAAQVADLVGNMQSNKIPVISFATPAIPVPLMQQRWPFLIRMASKGSAEMNCIADIVAAYKWRRVVVIYEDDGYGGYVGLLALLSEALQDANAKIEDHLVLPKVSSASEPNWNEIKELMKLPTFQSRVFIVLQSSLPTLTNLFRVAKNMGLVERESSWIITERVASLLDPQGNSDMEGALGIKTYYDSESSSYAEFHKEFQAKYAEGNDTKPGILTLRAYDTINVVSQAIERMPSNSTGTSSLQKMITTLLGNYKGGLICGNMHLKGGGDHEAVLDDLRFRILNVVNGKMDIELKLWAPEIGLNFNDGVGDVIWPGNHTHVPIGWGIPTAGKPLKIGVPAGNEHFGKFVKVEPKNNSDKMTYDGFSIRLFNMALSRLNYHLPYDFVPFNGSYDQLIEAVYNKTFDAAVGDFTVLPERADKVGFTQPYMPSGLSMVVVEKYEAPTWMFIRPFTWQMWTVSGVILIFTTLVLWIMERSKNKELCDKPLKTQIATTIYFTFSSLFFAHRESMDTIFGRVVFIQWLFLALILTSSYTANLSSMLTIRHPKSDVTIEGNATVGWDGAGEVMQSIPKDNYTNINIPVNEDGMVTLKSQKNIISALYLESPYAMVLRNQLCEGYVSIPTEHEFGGLSFMFQKGSPLARDFSKAILELMENGYVKQLQDTLLTHENQCSNSKTKLRSLSLTNFSGLFIICAATSTLCLLLSPIASQIHASNVAPSYGRVMKKIGTAARFTVRLGMNLRRGPSLADRSHGKRWDYSIITANTPESSQSFTSEDIECVKQR